MKKPNITFIFGAGAEVPYGLPSGGEFALEIFRSDSTPDKIRFREELKKIDPTSPYANWMPQGYRKKTVSAFGKPQREALLTSSLEHRRNNILDFFREFDEKAEQVRSQFQNDTGIDITETIDNQGGKFGESEYGQQIKFVEILEKDGQIDLFNAKYFGCLIRLLCENDDLKTNTDLRLLTRGFIEILIGALGKNLIQRLNESLFENDTDLNIFDDITGIFSIDYKKAGHDALSHILDLPSYKIRMKELNKSDPQQLIISFYTRLLETLLTGVLDYQSLIDGHFHYLYSPKAEYPKFCKISVFLYTVQRYIQNQYEENKDQIDATTGYYDDLITSSEDINKICVATSNYNTFIKDKSQQEVLFLNGSTEDYYDPYRNKIDSGNSDMTFTVPLLFTQSGIKPLTSIDMTLRYADLYRKMEESDCVVVCGFGFNSDDSHINGVLRAVVEDRNIPLIVIQRQKNGKSVDREKDIIKKKLRLNDTHGLDILFVDDKRSVNGQLWTSVIAERYTKDGEG